MIKITVSHDDQPEEVADKFLDAFAELGIMVITRSDPDEPFIQYEIEEE